MIISGSQLMNLVLSQVLPYLPLEDNDEHKEGEISLTTKDDPHLLIEDVMDDISYSDEYIDKMEKVLSDRYMEKKNEDRGKVKSVENIKEGSLMKHVQHLYA